MDFYYMFIIEGENMNEKGLTLVEVIIAMALVGMLAVVFIPAITAQYININKAGYKSKATYSAVEDIEEDIVKSEGEQTEKDEVKAKGDPDNVDIHFDDGTVPIPVNKVTVKTKKPDDREKKYKELDTELIVGIPE